MRRHKFSLLLLCGLSIIAAAPGYLVAQPPAAAVAAFNTYVSALESRLAGQHKSQSAFLAPLKSAPESDARLHHGELVVEQLTPAEVAMQGALLHHWRGTAFAQGATVADFERLMKDFNSYPRHFSPQVVRAIVLTQHGDHYQTLLRLRQRHIITVVMDATFDVVFALPDPRHGYSISRSTRISEIESPGTPAERTLSPGEEHGFLWLSNTYWSYEERDGGLYMQVESVSLTRSIPHGLAWAVRPFVESVPRDSLEFTLRATCNALRK